MMPHDEINHELIAELHTAIHAASRDYFIWTKGRILYEDGVEHLLTVYAAKRLFDLFGSQYEVRVRMEEPIAELLIGNTGDPRRVDLTLRFGSELLYVVEFKRYTNPARIRNDIDRLKEIVQKNATCTGLLAAPCYMNQQAEDWPTEFARRLNEGGLRCHLSEPRPLPSHYPHPQGWRRDQALVIEFISA